MRALANALGQGRLHHAYLFTGTRGVGKTTLARILAKCLNCETAAAPTASPCGACASCREIEAGRFVDLIEIDAASYTGVDNMREVIDNAQYAPTAGRYKVYIIDEVHMLSRNAFNAMLKTLEEPPAHVVFILATTDPQKVPVTVLSRCLQFNLKPMTAPQVAAHLRQVLEQEEVVFEPAALNQIARAAAGSMRDALSLTDQAVAHGGGRLEAAAVRDMLGSVDSAWLFPILDALADGDGPRLMREGEVIAERGLSFDAALQDLALTLQQIALAQVAPEALAEDLPERERILDLAGRIDAESVQLYYQIASLGRRDLEWAPDEAAGFSMTLLRMLAFRPATSLPAATVAPQPATTRPATPALSPGGRGGRIPAASTRAATGFDGDWHALAGRLQGGVRQLAAFCELAGHEPGRLRLRLPEDHKSLLASLGDKLRAALREQLGADWRIDIELGATGGSAPAEVQARNKAERQRQAEAIIAADPFIQTLIGEFDASISAIKPID